MRLFIFLILSFSAHIHADSLPSFEYDQDCLSAVRTVEVKFEKSAVTGQYKNQTNFLFLPTKEEKSEKYMVSLTCENELLKNAAIIYSFLSLDLAVTYYKQWHLQLTLEHGKPKLDFKDSLSNEKIQAALKNGFIDELVQYSSYWNNGRTNFSLAIARRNDVWDTSYILMSDTTKRIQP